MILVKLPYIYSILYECCGEVLYNKREVSLAVLEGQFYICPSHGERIVLHVPANSGASMSSI